MAGLQRADIIEIMGVLRAGVFAVIWIAIAGIDCRAWGPTGHKTVALIAWSRLDSSTKKKITAILGPSVYLDQIANCADFVKRDSVNCAHAFDLPAMPETAGWHYIDIPTKDSPNPSALAAYCNSNNQKDNCIVSQISKEVQALKDPASTRLQQQTAMMFLVHFVGDLHQPLHCATEVDGEGVSDRGGNDKAVHIEEDAKPMNLHQLWDDLIESPENVRNINPFDLAKKLESDLASKDTAGWVAGDITAAAAMESFGISKRSIYPAYEKSGGQNVGAAYRSEMQPIVYDRLERAGVRLAALLHQALAEPK